MIEAPFKPVYRLDNPAHWPAILERDFFPELKSLLDLHYGDYCRLFPGKGWQESSAGGYVAPHWRQGLTASYPLAWLLQAVGQMLKLEQFEGFDTLLHEFAREPDLGVKCFEVHMAYWCATRAVHRNLRFGPQIARGARTKQPEWLWETERGSAYCEVKSLRPFTFQFNAKLQQLGEVLRKATFDCGLISATHRVDLLISPTYLNGVERRIIECVRGLAKMAEGTSSEELRLGEVCGIWQPREIEPFKGKKGVRHMNFTADGVTAKRVHNLTSDSTLMLPIEARQGKALAKQVTHARGQFPKDSTGLVLLESDPTDHLVDRASKIVANVGTPDIPLIFICDYSTGRAVFRNGQPFDQDILAKATAPHCST